MNLLPKFFARALLVALLASASGCDSPTAAGLPAVQLSLPASVYYPGQSVEVTIESRSPRSWFTENGCNVGIERLVDGVWTSVYGVACLAGGDLPTPAASAQLWAGYRELKPLASEVMTWTLPPDAEFGVHRVRISLLSSEDGAGQTYSLTSPQFSVSPVLGWVR